MGTIVVDRVYDIECSDWTNFVLGGVLDAGGRNYREFRHGDELAAELLSRPAHIWSHNGGLYDQLWLTDALNRQGVRMRASCAGSRVTSLRVGKVTFHDSAALAPMKLSVFAQIGGEQKAQTGLPCVCGKECGGYCSISENMPVSLMKRLSLYLHQDCQVLLSALEALATYAELQGWELGNTVGASGWKSAQKVCDLPDAEWHQARDYHWAEGAKVGGRTQIFQPAVDFGHRADIHSAYPAALVETALPHGDYHYVGKERAVKAFSRGFEGIFQATVKVPLTEHIPALPWRYADRVCFPIGIVRGKWSGLELRYAVEELGYDVRFYGAMIWEESDKLLAPFMSEVWKCRDEAGKKTALGKWLKWFPNSCTGKFGQHPKASHLHFFPDPDKIRSCSDRNPCGGNCPKYRCCEHRHGKNCRAWIALGNHDAIWEAPGYRIANCAHVHWNIYLCAAARIKVHRQLVYNDSAVYCDTDSCYAVENHFRDLGHGLGQWGYDGTMDEWVAPAPKVYRYLDQDGKEVVKAKGLSGITPADFWRFLRGEAVGKSKGVKPLKSAIRQGGGSLFVRQELERQSYADGVHFGDRVLRSDGLTYPRTCEQIVKWTKSNGLRLADERRARAKKAAKVKSSRTPSAKR